MERGKVTIFRNFFRFGKGKCGEIELTNLRKLGLSTIKNGNWSSNHHLTRYLVPFSTIDRPESGSYSANPANSSKEPDLALPECEKIE